MMSNKEKKSPLAQLDVCSVEYSKKLLALQNKSYEEWQRELVLFSLEKRRVKGDLFVLHIKGGVARWGSDSYQLSSDKMRGIGLKLHRGGLGWILGDFSVRVVWHWNRLLREVGKSLSLEVFKKRIDVAWFSGALVSTRLKVGLRGLLQPEWFCDSMITVTVHFNYWPWSWGTQIQCPTQESNNASFKTMKP